MKLFNFEENKKYIDFFKNRAINQKKYIKNYFENNKILENFVEKLSVKKLNVNIGDVFFDTNDINFKSNLLDHLIYLFFYNKSFSFIIKEKSYIENLTVCSGFFYLNKKEIIFFEKEDFKDFLEKNKNEKLIPKSFKYKDILKKITLY